MRFFLLLFIVGLQLTLAQQKSELVTIKSYSDSLRVAVQKGNFELAKEIVSKTDSIAIFSKNDTVTSIANKLKANYFYRVSNYEEAMKYWLSAASGFEKLNDSLEASKVYNNISLILNTSEEFEQALKLKKKALHLCPSNAPAQWRINLLLNMGSSYRYLKEADSASFYYDKSYHLSKSIDYRKGLGTYHHANSIAFLEKGMYELALRHSDTVQRVYGEDISGPMFENSVFYSAKSLRKLGRYGEALTKAEESLALVLKSGMTINAAENYELLSEIQENLGYTKAAFVSLKRAKTYRDSIFNIEKNKAVLDMEKKYRTEKKENENLLLREETVKKDLKIARKNNFILVSSLVFTAIIVSLILYQLKKFRKKNRDLKDSIEYREKVERELEVVRDNIAKDFHDDLGNKLARITTLSDLMIKTSDQREKNQIIDALQRIKEDSDILFRGTRDFMFSLKAKSDYVEELFTYLSDFGEDFFRSFDIDFFLEKQVDINKKLPYYWNRQIIMIFKEAMTNTAKHAGATSANLAMHFGANQLTIVFQDNGNGFELEKLNRKSGLSNMVIRAKKIGGNLEINSDQQGTRVALDVSSEKNKEYGL